MKILHLVAGELNGGAARGAYWLHQALCKKGVVSKILTNGRETLSDPTVISLTQTPNQKLKQILINQLGSLPTKLYKKRKHQIFSTGFEGVNFLKNPAYQEADIIHLHWVNSLVNMRSLLKIDKPIIWTIRDMWPMTGGCHYSIDCNRYINNCGQCPQLGSKKTYDLSSLILSNKQKSIPNTLQAVGISSWVSECAKKSLIFKENSVTTISNNINTEHFFPINKTLSCEALCIKTNKPIVLIGAQNITDYYKGFYLFVDSLKYLDNFHFVFFGKTDKTLLDQLNIEYTNLGFLSDYISMRLAYSAADIFVAPSRMDAFGKTIAEAMACKTPVVCFDATGPKDIVKHKQTGYRATPFNPEDLARGIKWVSNCSKNEYSILCKNARQQVLENFDSSVIAEKYIHLYKTTLLKGLA
ncbi:MAG: glycosyltransferase family 4 protein [Rhodomicrobiaceae bacterium]